MNAPCLKCSDRYPGCHDCCEKFSQYREELEHIKSWKDDYKKKEESIWEVAMPAYNKWEKEFWRCKK